MEGAVRTGFGTSTRKPVSKVCCLAGSPVESLPIVSRGGRFRTLGKSQLQKSTATSAKVVLTTFAVVL